MTVYYAWGGKRVAYTIVGAPALKEPAAATTTRNGVQMRTFQINDRVVVTWRRNGHTCVLSAVGVSPDVLQMLASWKAPAAA